MLSHAVLAGGVHALKDDQHRPFAVGEQPLLNVGGFLIPFGKDSLHPL